MNVISCSRRTDIPAFYWGWLKEQIKQGFVIVPNPFSKREFERSLSPTDVSGFVFWSKNYKNLLRDWSFLEVYPQTDRGAPFYFHFTINSEVQALERSHSNSLEERVDQACELAEMFGPERVMWRFDPIVHWTEEGSDLVQDNLGDFSFIAESLVDGGIGHCTISFATVYKKIHARARSTNIRFVTATNQIKKAVLSYLFERKPPSLELISCCDPELPLNGRGCINGNYLEQIWGKKITKARDTGQREACLCTKSVDIGNYSQRCYHNCLYCYAQPSL